INMGRDKRESIVVRVAFKKVARCNRATIPFTHNERTVYFLNDDGFSNPAILKDGLSERFNLVLAPKHFIKLLLSNRGRRLTHQVLNSRVRGIQVDVREPKTHRFIRHALVLNDAVMRHRVVSPLRCTLAATMLCGLGRTEGLEPSSPWAGDTD